MAQSATATDDTPSYTITIHERALASWRVLPDAVRDRFETLLDEAAHQRRPSTHAKASMMREGSGIFRLRHDSYRVLCDKNNGQLRVLVAGHRETVYDKFSVAKERARDE